jgi:hypothetical protein
VTTYLKYRIELEEKMGPKKDKENKKTKRFEKKKSVP